MVECKCMHPCTCIVDIHPGFAECPLCKKVVCPDCGSADVVCISRVTGYMSDVSGWGSGKRQEMRERKRYSVE